MIFFHKKITKKTIVQQKFHKKKTLLLLKTFLTKTKITPTILFTTNFYSINYFFKKNTQKTWTSIGTKLKNWNYDNLKISNCENSKTQIFTNKNPSYGNSNTLWPIPIVRKLKNSTCDKTQKLKLWQLNLWQSLKPQIATKL